MIVKYETTIYNKKYPYGKNIIAIAKGEEVKKPDYLVGCKECIFIKTVKNIIHIIEKECIITIK